MSRLTQFGTGSQVFDFANAGYVVQAGLNDNFAQAMQTPIRTSGVDGGQPAHGYQMSSAIGKVTYNAVLVAQDTSQMDAYRTAIRTMRGWGKHRLYRTSNEQTQWCDARVNYISKEIDHASGKDDLQQPVTIIWQVSDPVWYSLATEAWRWDDGTKWDVATWDGSAAENAISGTSTEFTLTVGGTAPTLARLVLATAAGQSCENPVVQRIISGSVVDQVSYAGTVSAGDVLTINARKREGRVNSNVVRIERRYNRWFELVPGVNNLRVLCDNAGDAASLYVYYYERTL